MKNNPNIIVQNGNSSSLIQYLQKSVTYEGGTTQR